MKTTTKSATFLAGLAVAASSSIATAQPTELTDSPDLEVRQDTQTPRHAKMALELLAIQTVGTAWYWRNTGDGWGEANRVDWQLGFKGSALVAKLDGEGWRMDGNPYLINSLCHPMSGSLSYYLARQNGYSPLGAFAASTLLSVSWELFTEYAEYGAPNDLLTTSPVGFSIGESAYQIRNHWRQTAKQLSIGAGSADGEGFVALGGRLALNTMPTAEGDGTIVGGKKVTVGIEVPFDGAVRAVEADAKSSVVGYYRNRAKHQLFTGLSSELYFRNQNQRESRDWDYLTTVSLGPTVDATLKLASATVDVGADVYAEFGMLKAEGFDTWRSTHSMAVVRNSMMDRRDPYYYAYGVAISPRVNVQYKGVSVGGKVVAHQFQSMNGVDRDQETMTADPTIRDTDTTAEAWIAYTHRAVSVSVDGRAHKRTGSVDDARASHADTTTMFAVSYER